MNLTAEQKRIIFFYGVFVLALIAGFIPHLIFSVMSLSLFSGGLLVAYRERKLAHKDSLAYNHMTYLIRSVWISSLIATATSIIALIYAMGNYDPAPLQRCIDQLTGVTSADMDMINVGLQPCIAQFVSGNKPVFIISTLIAAGPGVVYFIYRLIKGGTRALKAYRLPRKKSWL